MYAGNCCCFMTMRVTWAIWIENSRSNVSMAIQFLIFGTRFDSMTNARNSDAMQNVSSNISNTGDGVSSGYPNTEKRV